MNLSYDGKRFEATPEFIQAVKDLMKAEIEMMRGVSDNPLNWSIGIAKADDLAGVNWLSIVYGSYQDFATIPIGPREILYAHPREETKTRFGQHPSPETPPVTVWEVEPMDARRIAAAWTAGRTFYQVTQMNIIECKPIGFINKATKVDGVEPVMWLADNGVGRLGGNSVAPNTYFATKEAAVAQLRKNIIGFVDALNEGVLQDNPAVLPIVLMTLEQKPAGLTWGQFFEYLKADTTGKPWEALRKTMDSSQ